jgi:hypothetical protein
MRYVAVVMQHYVVQHHICCCLEFNIFAVHSSKGLLAAQHGIASLPCCKATKKYEKEGKKQIGLNHAHVSACMDIASGGMHYTAASLLGPTRNEPMSM